MKEEELRAHIRANYPRENEACEWKAFTNLKNSWSSHEGEDVESYISAIANMNGGHLVVGVEDKTLNIVGIKKFGDYSAINVRLRLTGKVTNLDTENLKVEEITTSDTKKTIWIIHIPKHFPRLPVYAHRKVWQRLDDNLIEMRRERLNAILSESWGGVDWSADIVEEASLADLDASAIRKAREKYKGKNSIASWHNEIDDWDTTTFLDKAGLTAQGKVTRAAILLVGQENSAHFVSPHPAQLTWKLYGTDSYHHFGPPFILSTTVLLDKIRNETHKLFPNNQLLRVEIPTYDTRTILEGLHNCIAHQDYERCERVLVTEMPDSEPPRVCRRPFRLSHAAMAVSSSMA